jgi:hypothetical protein
MNLPKDTTPKTFCFVLMPFSDAFSDIYQIGIKEACMNAGAYCERVDEQIFHDKILDRVYNQIAKADLVIADMTGRNPNVFYEVGYAHALGKLTILLTQSADDIPFDLRPFPHIMYGAKLSVLREQLERKVRYFIENPPDNPSDFKLGIEVFLAEKNLAQGDVVCNVAANETMSLDFMVHNSSVDTLSSGDFQIGVLIGDRFSNAMLGSPIEYTKIPSGEYLLLLPDFPNLFPGSYLSYRAYLGHTLNPGEERTITIKLFTRQGVWDFPVIIACKGSSQ